MGIKESVFDVWKTKRIFKKQEKTLKDDIISEIKPITRRGFDGRIRNVMFRIDSIGRPMPIVYRLHIWCVDRPNEVIMTTLNKDLIMFLKRLIGYMEQFITED